FYSLQDTRTPEKVAAVAMVTNIGLSLLLMNILKHNGLALANAMASAVNFLLLFYLLRKRMGGIGTGRIVVSFARIFIASAAMGTVGWFLAGFMEWREAGNALLKALYLGGVIVLCGGVYMLVSYLLRSEEMVYLADRIRERMQKRRNRGN
ncbi:MAG: lipid II flippase MurJ, partial [Thermodesulfovibrionales bacterium]